MKIREHRGQLADSMITCVEIAPSIQAVRQHVEKCLGGHAPKPLVVTVEPYTYDERIGWDTHVVLVEGHGVFGFTDGPVTRT